MRKTKSRKNIHMMEIMALEPEQELVLDDNAGAMEIAAAQDDNEEDDLL